VQTNRATSVVGKPALRVDVVELGGGDEAEHESSTLTATVRSGEEPGLFLPMAMPRITRSAQLFVRQMRPSSRKAAKRRLVHEHVVHGIGEIGRA